MASVTESQNEQPVSQELSDTTHAQDEISTSQPTETQQEDPQASTTDATSTPPSSTADRLSRFRALQARAKSSSTANLKAATAESQRLASDPSALTSLNRKHAIASHNLLKADVEEAGEDFERKRAWDWTAEESEKWDRRMEKKKRHREDVAFQDYTQEARKNYKRQMRGVQVDRESYEMQKAEAVKRAAEKGGLELVENEDGEIVAIDKEGRFGEVDASDFVNSRPTKEGVDRLVEDLKKAEAQRLKQRGKRKEKEDRDPDVTYINDKNKQFNQKLARYYNKYTTDIRESFERGTMI